MAALFASSPGQWASKNFGVCVELVLAVFPVSCAIHACPPLCAQEIGDLLTPPSRVDEVAAAAVAHVLDQP